MGIDAAAAEVQSVIEPQAGRLQFPRANCGLLAGGAKERTNFRVRVWKRTLNAKPYGSYRVQVKPMPMPCGSEGRVQT